VGSLPPPGDAAFWGRCVLFVALPDLTSERFFFDERASPSRIADTFMAPLRRHLPPALPSEHVFLQPLDRMALPLVIEQSGELMRRMGVDRFVVLAVDSLVDAFALHWLGEAGRLKSDLNPVGLMPGECAAALLLEAERRGVHDERPAWAVVTTVATGRDAAFDDRDAPPRGRTLAEVLAPAITGGTVDLFSDLNGEAWRAREHGTALVHLGGVELDVHHAAAEVGDVGAASSVLDTVLAARSLQRGYARANRVTVAISSDDGGVGALALRRA
jgi:3-oxoacyl-[acyl-carrier-protein] synthase-1